MTQDAIKPRYWALLFITLTTLVGLGVRLHKAGPMPNLNPHVRSHFYDKTYAPKGTLE